MKITKILESSRLVLMAATERHVRTELEAPDQLTHLLDATVSSEWPSGEYDRQAMEFFLSRFEEEGERAEGWYGWYALGSDCTDGSRVLVGAGGYFGPPDADGNVEVGYSILPEWQRRGYASDMVKMLTAHAFTFMHINRVIAHTAAENLGSIAVLCRCGFHENGAGAETGTLRFERTRAISP